MKDQIVESVREKLLHRSETGISKYNQTLFTNNKDNFLKHFQEEMLDGVNYIEKLLQQGKDITQLVKKHPNDSELGMQIRKIYG